MELRQLPTRYAGLLEPLMLVEHPLDGTWRVGALALPEPGQPRLAQVVVNVQQVRKRLSVWLDDRREISVGLVFGGPPRGDHRMLENRQSRPHDLLSVQMLCSPHQQAQGPRMRRRLLGKRPLELR